jgi:hypothetical protein
MYRTLLDIPIEESMLPCEMLVRLKKIGISSIGHVFQMPRKRMITLLDIRSTQADIIRQKAIQTGEQYGFGRAQLEKKYGDIISLVDAANLLGYNTTTDLKNMLNKGVFNSFQFTLEIGKESLPKSGNESHLVFIKDRILKFKEDYKSLTAIAKEFGFNEKSLFRYNAIGKLDEARLDPQLKRFNVQWIKNNYLTIREEGIKKRRDKTSGVQKAYFSLLGKELQEWINRYLDHRKEFVIHFHGTQFKPFETKDAWKEHKAELGRLFYFAICAKSDIHGYWVIEKEPGYRNLTHEEIAEFNPLRFDLLQFSSNNLIAMLKGKESKHAKYAVRKYLKPFLWYVLQQMKNDVNERELIERVSLDTERAHMQRWAEQLEDLFISYTPIPPRQGNKFTRQSHGLRNKSIFLIRSQIVKLFNTILWDSSMRDPLKFATMILLAFLAVIRPNELRQVKIGEHLVVDKETGLVKMFDIDGLQYGRLIITEEISKKGQSPSGDYDILLVPNLVRVINIYLKRRYEKYPDTKGKGYLFRPEDKEGEPEFPYSDSGTMFSWLYDHKSKFSEFFTDHEMKYFSSYDTRHTGNNLIVNKTFFNDSMLDQLKNVVAKYHCRHWGDFGINEGFYQEGFTEEMYAEIIHGALGFPLEVKELMEWEKNVLPPEREKRIGHSTEALENEKEPELTPEELEEQNREIQIKVKQLENEMKELGKKSNQKKYEEQGLDFMKRVERANEIKKEIEQLRFLKQ